MFYNEKFSDHDLQILDDLIKNEQIFEILTALINSKRLHGVEIAIVKKILRNRGIAKLSADEKVVFEGRIAKKFTIKCDNYAEGCGGHLDSSDVAHAIVWDDCSGLCHECGQRDERIDRG